MINLIVQSGLGNQMFQYAFARLLQELYLQEGKEESIQIINHFIDNYIEDSSDVRQLALNNLTLCPTTTTMQRTQQPKAMRIFKIRTLLASGVRECYKWRILKRYENSDDLSKRRAKWGIYFPYGPYPYMKVNLSKVKDKYIFGFFQHYGYISPIEDILKQELRVKTPASPANKTMLSCIESSNAVCLHIRRGDYLNSRWKNLQICDFDYYNQAINHILDHTDKPVFYVFSNTHEDLEWIKENYKFNDFSGKNRTIETVFVDLNNPDYEELRLMYSCKHFIISNSTFSWWGAWLGNAPDKIVITPQRWNLEFDNDTNIYDPTWIRLPK